MKSLRILFALFALAVSFSLAAQPVFLEAEAFDRCGGRLGNKGDEAAVTAIRMAGFRRKIKDVREKISHQLNEEFFNKMEDETN